MSRSSARHLLVACMLFAAGVSAADYPEFPGERLEVGRTIWIDNCEGCHAYGIAGAPIPSNAGAWAPRIAKGADTLYQNAIEGFFGPKGTMMPARGGNDALTEEQVGAAVDYMVRLASNAESNPSN